jgi:hypothetical protein
MSSDTFLIVWHTFFGIIWHNACALVTAAQPLGSEGADYRTADELQGHRLALEQSPRGCKI